MMKYLAIALFAAVIALFPYVLGKMSVSDTLERYRNACYDLSINARPFYVEQGYLSSTLTLDEPLSTTISSMGLSTEAVDFFRDLGLNLRVEVAHGPMHMMKGAEHAVLSIKGPDWRFTGEEWRTNKLFGASSRCVRIYDNTITTEGVTFCVSNFWLRDSGAAAEMTADRFAILPGLSVTDLKYNSETTEDEQTTGTLSASEVTFGGAAISNLIVKIESSPVIKGGTKRSVHCEIEKGAGSLGDLAGKTVEFDTKDKFYSGLISVFRDEMNLETFLAGGGND
jgi:hypothetical protein